MLKTIPHDVAQKLDSLSSNISDICFTSTGKLNEIGKLLMELYQRRKDEQKK